MKIGICGTGKSIQKQIENTITANKAQTITKRALNPRFTYEPWYNRMFNTIEAAANVGKNYIMVDLIEYSYYLNMSLTNTALKHLMGVLMSAARRKGFICTTILCEGEYLFKVSWAEET